jgi:3-oxoacyl-[acyl-carrier protein] reductase
MPYSIDLKGKTALITGGTRGIGAAIADIFAQAGANLIITGTQSQGVDSRVKALEEITGNKVQGWVADFTDSASLANVCSRIRELPSLDILINNAGTNLIVPIDEIDAKDLKTILDLNLHAPTLLSGAAASSMKRARWGRILNIASIWSVITKPGRAMYTASKFGLVGLTKATAADLGPHNILVNALSPGFTLTDLTHATVPLEEQKRIAQQVPMRRFAEPEEMAKVALFLCSELNTYVTGQNIVVDGGFVSV